MSPERKFQIIYKSREDSGQNKNYAYILWLYVFLPMEMQIRWLVKLEYLGTETLDTKQAKEQKAS
jgi:hypothetical protein